MDTTVLIVEDETVLADLLADYLQKEGFQTMQIHDGAQVMAQVQQVPVDLVLLDIMLPNKDGISLCREIRQLHETMPIIMTTAKVEEIDRLLGLEMGADDYVCKPYSPREVVARVKAVLRRARQSPEHSAELSGLLLNADDMSISANGQKLGLTQVEYQLLATMMNTPNKIFSRQQLMDQMYSDYRIVSDRTIDSHIKKLRKKLENLSGFENAELIHSVYGVGYKFVTPGDY